MRGGGLAAAAALAACVSMAAAPAGGFVTRDAYLMGTRARLVAWSSGRTAGLETLERALDILETTEAELSTWRDTSVISRLNHHPVGRAFALPADLCDMFGELYAWHAATARAFDPAIGRLVDAWGIQAGGRVPPTDGLQEARRQSGLRLIEFDRARCELTRRGDVRLDVGAFGKGEALDRVVRALADGVWMIDLGGQVTVNGVPPDTGAWPVALAHPRDRERPWLEVAIAEGSLATSGGSERDLSAAGTRIGHILDPRTGRPAAYTGSVTVWHRRGLIADILSTALYVMGPEQGLAFAERHGIAACFLAIGPQGAVDARTSTAFRPLLTPSRPDRRPASFSGRG